MKKSADAGSVRHVTDAANISKFVACLAFAGQVAFFNEAALIGLGASVYLGWVGACLFRVSPSRRLSIRILLTWVGVLLTGILNTSESITKLATDPLSFLGFCVASGIVCVIALAVVESIELVLIICWCLVRNAVRRPG